MMFKNSILFQKKYHFALLFLIVLFFLFGLWCYIYTIRTSGVNVDPAYYLSIVERMREGNIVYKDVLSGYTPIMYHLMVLVKDVFGIGINYQFDLSFLLVMQLFNCFFLYKIGRSLKLNPLYASFLMVFFFIGSISFWKFEFILEPFATFFGLASLWFLQKSKNVFFFLSAICCSLAFLTKQYALVFLALNLYLIFSKTSKCIKPLLLYILFFLVPIAFYFLYNENFIQIFYVKYSNYANENKTITTLFLDRFLRIGNAALLFLQFFPILLVAFFVLLFNKLLFKKEVVFALLGLCGFLLQFLFAPFYHYYLFLVPFAFFLVFYAMQTIKNRFVFFGFLVIFLWSTFILLQRTISIVKSEQTFTKAAQTTAVHYLKKDFHSQKNVYVLEMELNSLYYLLNLAPPQNDYTFGIASDGKFARKQIMASNYFICLESTQLEPCLSPEELATFFVLDTEFPIQMWKKPNKILIYKKKNNVTN